METILDPAARGADRRAARGAVRRASRRRSLAGLLSLWLRRARTRRQLRELAPERLADIGIGEAERRREAKKPFWEG
ncbi:DUF1127 domain-containing protein [Afifella sp. IM 167]|uniref:DUF1127 domain-containing protein n=1 Tax=Afifella sp. IM 167 TaxID=2033586 RepID=UPI001CCBFC52|nr:DUF1127 domain-containing protein [Afifella sp. IM 167]MBZ8135477.1 hypothetical protein [Afifella sp. IM 167]